LRFVRQAIEAARIFREEPYAVAQYTGVAAHVRAQ
jgi:hypothetical protein